MFSQESCKKLLQKSTENLQEYKHPCGKSNAINNLNSLSFLVVSNGAIVKKSEINFAVSGSEARNDDERDRGNGFWQTRQLQD